MDFIELPPGVCAGGWLRLHIDTIS